MSGLTSTTMQLNWLFDYDNNVEVAESQYSVHASAADYVINYTIHQSAFFKTSTYSQNSANSDDYDVDLSVDATGWNKFYDEALTGTMVAGEKNSHGVDGDQAASVLGVVGTDTGTLGLRFLEIAALEIFGHAKARAAIVNDKDFFLSEGSVKNGSAIQRPHLGKLRDDVIYQFTQLKDDIFQQYVATGRYLADHKDKADPHDGDLSAYPFNFGNLSLDMYIKFTGETKIPGPIDPVDGTTLSNSSTKDCDEIVRLHITFTNA